MNSPIPSLDLFHAVSVDLRRTPENLAARLILSPERVTEHLERLLGQVTEALLLGTCHRLELYVVPRPGGMGPTALLSELTEMGAEELMSAARTLQGEAAARHLFRVAAGLESSSLGEHEVLGQVGHALDRARAAGLAGPLIDRLGRGALNAGRRARAETTIATTSLSLVGAGLELAVREIGPLEGRAAVVAGSGTMARRAVRSLQAQGALVTMVARNPESRRELAAAEGVAEAPWEELGHRAAASSLLVVATAADTAILGPADLGAAPPPVIIDLAMPANVSPDVRVSGCRLIDLAELSARCESNREDRVAVAGEVERLADQALAAELAWLTSRESVPLIQALRERADGLRAAEVDWAVRQLGHLSDRDRRVVEAMAERLVNKLLHLPVTSLRQPGMAARHRRALVDMFQLAATDPEGRTTDGD